MAPATPRLRILSVGGNAVSAFLSWRLQATNACDVTLVWKSNYEQVAQYGISIKSQTMGNERFKPHAVVRTPEEAAQNSDMPFDYVLLCVKALPDVYDLASVIEAVVTPQHTCIILNTSNNLGIEEYIEDRFSTNVVLSLVCGAELNQTGASEFEHKGDKTDLWVGWANNNPGIPASIQKDMAEALAMTLCTAKVSCLVSLNIRQQQFEKMIGPIAFHPASVVFQCHNHTQLLEMAGVRTMIIGVIDELINLAVAHGCTFPDGYMDDVMESMKPKTPNDIASVMYQDFVARRPMEVETFLGSPIKLAAASNIAVPRIEVLYALLHDINQKNLNPPVESPSSPGIPLPPRTSSAAAPGGPGGPGPRPLPNGQLKNGRPGGRAPSLTNGPPMMRRGPPPPANGYPPRMPNGSVNGFGPNGGQYSRRGSADANDLEEFSHLMLYDNANDGTYIEGYAEGGAQASGGDLGLRERELMIRQKELELREREQHLQMRRNPVRRPPPAAMPGVMYDDEDEDDDFFDTMGGRAPNMGPVDDNLDMMSITSRRNRKATRNSNPVRPNMPSSRGKGMFGHKVRSSASGRMMSDMPSPHDMIMNSNLLGYSSNRYGTVDRQAIEQESRQNSITNSRMEELAARGGPWTYGAAAAPPPRRSSQSPGNPLSPSGPIQNGYGSSNGVQNGRPSPPGMRQPVPRHPPGHGNSVAPQQVEQHAGVRSQYPSKPNSQVRGLTGSASASASSGDSGVSANLGSENSTQYSSSKLQQSQIRISVRS